MEGVRRRQARRDNDYVQSLKLFRELLEAVGGKMQTLKQQTRVAEEKEVKVKQQKIANECKKFNKFEANSSEASRRIELRVGRDWEGLCSERKEDVLGEYAICFEYQVMEREEGRNIEHIIEEESGVLQGGSCSNL